MLQVVDEPAWHCQLVYALDPVRPLQLSPDGQSTLGRQRLGSSYEGGREKAVDVDYYKCIGHLCVGEALENTSERASHSLCISLSASKGEGRNSPDRRGNETVRRNRDTMV